MFKETGPENGYLFSHALFESNARIFYQITLERSHLTAVHLRPIVHMRVFICPITKLYENLIAVLLNICKYYQGVKLMMFSIKLWRLIHFCNKKARADHKETTSEL